MSSQETDHVSPTEVIPELGKGALGTWRPTQPYGGRLDKTGTYAGYGIGGEAVGKPGVAGVYTNQCLNLSKPWEGSRMICQGFKPDPGNLAARDFRGASRNVRHGETVNPPAIERAGPERSSRQGRSLAGCKSPHRQLPVFGRLAYPMRGEVTNRVLLGPRGGCCRLADQFLAHVRTSGRPTGAAQPVFRRSRSSPPLRSCQRLT